MKKTLLALSFALFLSACASNSKKKPTQNPPAVQPGGEETNPLPGGQTMRIKLTADTRFRANAEAGNDYTNPKLTPENDVFCRLPEGTVFTVVQNNGTEGKFLAVTLNTKPGSCNFSTGYFFNGHVCIVGQPNCN